MDNNKTCMLKLKAKNPFIVLFHTFGMYGFYLIAIIATIVNIHAPISNIIYFDLFLFCMFYGITVLVSLFYIYTSLKYGDICIVDQNKVMIKNRCYANITIKMHVYCGRFLCTKYINFYSDDKLIGRYFLHLGYKVTHISEDMIKKIFHSDQNTTSQ